MKVFSEKSAQSPTYEIRGRRITRRQILQGFALGSGAVAVSTVAGGFFNKERNLAAIVPQQPPGGQAGGKAEDPKEVADKPIEGTHILEVIGNNPELQQKISRFLSIDFDPSSHLVVPATQEPNSSFAQVVSPTGGYLSISVRHASPINSWERTQRLPGFNKNQWNSLEGARVTVRDMPPLVNLQGFADPGTPHETAFFIEANSITRLGSMPREARQGEIQKLTGSLLVAGVLTRS